MPIQDINLTESAPVWSTLVRVRRTLGLESKQMAELLTLTGSEYQKYSMEQKELPARSLLQLCRTLHISFDHLMTDKFCYRTMARHFYGDKDSIPEKYTIAGKSKRRVLGNILDFVEVASDYQRRLELMRFLQINEAALRSPDSTINLRCTMEAVAWLGHYSKNDELLRRLGREMLLSPHNYQLFENLRHCRSIYELFEALLFESGVLYTYFEKNFLWKIHKIIPGRKVIVRGYVNDEVREYVGDKLIRSRGGVLGRMGLSSAFPEILGWDPVPVTITDFFGRSEEFYELEFDISQIIKATPRASLALAH